LIAKMRDTKRLGSEKANAAGPIERARWGKRAGKRGKITLKWQ
jgi:hypothetical protein